MANRNVLGQVSADRSDILWPILASGNVIGHPSRTFSAAPTLNRLDLVPFIVESPVTFDGIGHYQWNTNTTGTARIRFGIYDSDSMKRPRNLILDAGTLTPGTSDTFQYLSINQTLTRGLYYTAFVAQVANMNGSVGVGEAFGAWIRASYATTSGESWNGVAHNYIISNVTGALSATLGTASSNINPTPKVFLRVA